MRCPSCDALNDPASEACFTCGKALYALTQGVVLAARYEVLRPLGKGGMGRVYKAFDSVLREPVAIKVLRPELTGDAEMAARFRSEIKLARMVSHRNVCRIHEYGEEGRVAFISMEYIDGPTLAERLDVRRPEPGEAFELALQIAAGLEAIHEQGIVHRDFKPGNVMLDARGVAKIVDFGIAKLVSSETTGHTGVIGTPEYMSPEQGSGAKVDVRSDVYSLGCVVYELFAERPPFRGETALATLYMHQKERPPLETARVPEPLVPVLARALAKDPKDRFPRVADFAEALRAARDAWGGASLPRPLTPVPRPLETTTIPPRRRKARLRSAAPWLGAAAAAALSLALALRYGGADRPAPTGRPSAEPVAASATPPPIAPPARAVAPRPESARGAPRPVPTPGAEARDVQPTARPRAQQAQPAAPATTRPAAAAPPTPAAATDAEAGLLTILVIPAAEIEVDGASLGVATQRELRLPPGPHTVKILHPDYQPLQRKVHVRTGVTSTLVLDLAEKAIRK